MPTSDPATILLDQNMWATRNMIEACAELSHDQFHHKFELGPGSLHETLRHILAAMQGWGDLLAGREQRALLDGEKTTDELLHLLDELGSDLAASAAAHATDELVAGSRGGRSYTFARGAVITHVTTHGMHHRAQCLNMLRHLGVEPLPPSSVVEWVIMVDSTGDQTD
jgi:uncharacterized damage-inducible protein DinB